MWSCLNRVLCVKWGFEWRFEWCMLYSLWASQSQRCSRTWQLPSVNIWHISAKQEYLETYLHIQSALPRKKWQQDIQQVLDDDLGVLYLVLLKQASLCCSPSSQNLKRVMQAWPTSSVILHAVGSQVTIWIMTITSQIFSLQISRPLAGNLGLACLSFYLLHQY